MLNNYTFRNTLAVLLLACAAIGSLSAQDLNHKQADDFADWLVADGQYAKAAGLYAEAFEERSRNVYAYKAAELYFFVKNYSKAAKFYEAAAKSSDFPDARLKYARSLKHMGKFDDADTQYANYAKAYVAEDSSSVRAAVKVERAGIELAVAELERVDPTVFVDRISAVINGMKNEIAPTLDAKGNIVFISDFDGTMRAYSSERAGDSWTQMRPAPALPVIEDGNIGGGTLVSADRFVFSLCPTTDLMTQPGDVNCTIQEVTRRGGTWGEPKPVGGNINVEGFSAAQPFIFEEGGKEIMIFASNRTGTVGGMDLWKAERGVGEKVYGTPVNLGNKVNTTGNEVTPFFNTESRVLSFSTNGAVSLGGYDIVHATATDGVGNWTAATNPGTPINSSADDYYYREVPGTSRAFLSSNRSADISQTLMVNDDLYAVTYDSRNITVEVSVIDDATGQPVSDPTMVVKLNPDGFKLKPMVVRRSLDGYFSFTLPVEREITVEVERPYFDAETFTIEIPANEQDGFAVKPIRIERTPVGNDDIQVVARTRRPGSTTEPVKREVMTASGEGEEKN